MPKIRTLVARDANDLPVGVVSVPQQDQHVARDTITWTCGVDKCSAKGDRLSSAANAVASLEEHLEIGHSD